ncbi:hypothetical protein ALC62_15386 [Cyphomyrmex costatus]|uniref:DUF4806 domain-containing protein n=1 Tax=Cyphomyrmex costatus TaxID=456900 RepID=A0A151I793_9HYME|nr:hypothetical protein ALC62_15386 [Cyphomyrmex costatus]
MIKQLARLTGRDIKHSCLSLMRQISNEIAVLYSWHGAKKKGNFSKLNLCQVILSIVRNAHESAKDDQISGPIKIWLAHAKERMDRLKEKNKEADHINQNIPENRNVAENQNDPEDGNVTDNENGPEQSE